MKIRNLIVLLLFGLTSFGQNGALFFNMGGPKFAGGGGSNVEISGTPDTKFAVQETVHNLTSVTAGTLLVVTTGSELGGDGGIDATITSSPSLTWTKRADGIGAGGSAEIWTALFTAGGSIDVTVDWFPAADLFHQVSVVYKVINPETTFGTTGVQTTSAGQNAPNLNVVTTRSNSIIIVVSGDFNAENVGSGGSGITFRGTGATIGGVVNGNGTGPYPTVVSYYYPAATATTYAVGWTAPSAGDPTFNTAAIEIRGN